MCSRARSCWRPMTARRCCRPGMCAGFPAGTGDAHRFVNRTERDVTLLVIGDRTAGDEVSYPDFDLHAALGPDGAYRFTTKAESRSKLSVVPANAGPITPGEVWGDGVRHRAPSIGHAVLVPAFARDDATITPTSPARRRSSRPHSARHTPRRTSRSAGPSPGRAAPGRAC